MTDSSTKTFIDLETTGNNTRAIMTLKGKTSGGGDVTLKIGAFGDTQRGEIFTTTNHDPFVIPEDYMDRIAEFEGGKAKYLRAKKTMAYNDLIIKEFLEKVLV